MSGRPMATNAPNRRQIAIDRIRALLGAENWMEAHKQTQAFLAKHRNDPEGHFLMALIAEQARNIGLARHHIELSLKAREHHDSLFFLSRLQRRVGQTDEALDTCDRALRMTPGNVPLLIHQAGILEEAGRFDDARQVVDPLIARLEALGQEIPPPLKFELSKLLVQEKDFDLAVEVIDGIVDHGGTQQELRRLALYLKAKACDRSKRYEEAWESAGRANLIGQLEFSGELYHHQVDALMASWSAERMAKFPTSKCEDELPVFIAGMPRSGTSLIDQIIDAHPKAAGVGELATIEHFAHQLSSAYDPDKEPPACFGKYDSFRWNRVAQDYVKDLRKRAPAGTERVVNKALGNNKLVGLLAKLFPRTRIIHALRDPRDVAISCYMGGFNDSVHPWTTKPDWVADAWAESRRMMAHWEETLDVPIFEVRYEELVRDPDTQFPRLIEFLGLEWDDACRDFYKSRRTVRTLSYDQVNRPLYTQSAGRHANYAEQLEDVSFPDY